MVTYYFIILEFMVTMIMNEKSFFVPFYISTLGHLDTWTLGHLDTCTLSFIHFICDRSTRYLVLLRTVAAYPFSSFPLFFPYSFPLLFPLPFFPIPVQYRYVCMCRTYVCMVQFEEEKRNNKESSSIHVLLHVGWR
jgi:hypothetical protein